MAVIRNDFEGAVFVRGEDHSLVCLVAGDIVPDGAQLGSHLFDVEDLDIDESEGDGEGNEPAGNAKAEEWHAYALTQGISPEMLDGLKRDEIKALLK